MAWVALCLALSLHVADEALSGFLAVYNPTVLALRHEMPWLPLPIFRFEAWLAGLILASLLMFSLSVFVFRGARWIRPIAYAFALIMVLNGLGHALATVFGRTVRSVRIPGAAPGFYSSPLLLAAAIWLLVELRRSAASTSPAQSGRQAGRLGL